MEWHDKALHISSRVTHNWHVILNPSVIICLSGSTRVNLRAQRNSELENLGAVKNLLMKQKIFFFLKNANERSLAVDISGSAHIKKGFLSFYLLLQA